MLIFFFPSFFLLHMNYGDWTIGLRVYIALFIYFFRLLLLYEIVIIFRPFSTLCSIQGNRFSLRQNIKYIYVFSNFRYQPGKLRRKLVLLKLVRKKFSVERFFFFSKTLQLFPLHDLCSFSFIYCYPKLSKLYFFTSFEIRTIRVSPLDIFAFFFLHLTCRRKSMEYSQKITSKSQVKPGHRKWKLVPERSSEEVHRPRVSVRVAVSLLLQPLKRKLK